MHDQMSELGEGVLDSGWKFEERIMDLGVWRTVGFG